MSSITVSYNPNPIHEILTLRNGKICEIDYKGKIIITNNPITGNAIDEHKIDTISTEEDGFREDLFKDKYNNSDSLILANIYQVLETLFIDRDILVDRGDINQHDSSPEIREMIYNSTIDIFNGIIWNYTF